MTQYLRKTYSQLRATSLTPVPEIIEQVRGRTGRGYSHSSLPSDFCGIKSILSALLNCSKQRDKVWAVLLKLPSKQGQLTPKEAVVCDLCPSHKQLTRMQVNAHSNPAPFGANASKVEAGKQQELRAPALCWA